MLGCPKRAGLLGGSQHHACTFVQGLHLFYRARIGGLYDTESILGVGHDVLSENLNRLLLPVS
jgi:hypothetical protein